MSKAEKKKRTYNVRRTDLGFWGKWRRKIRVPVKTILKKKISSRSDKCSHLPGLTRRKGRRREKSLGSWDPWGRKQENWQRLLEESPGSFEGPFKDWRLCPLTLIHHVLGFNQDSETTLLGWSRIWHGMVNEQEHSEKQTWKREEKCSPAEARYSGGRCQGTGNLHKIKDWNERTYKESRQLKTQKEVVQKQMSS